MYNKDKLKAWFELFKAKYKKFDIVLKNYWNIDKKGYALSIIEIIKVIIVIKKQRKVSTFLTQYDNREWVSLIECVSIDDRKLEL